MVKINEDYVYSRIGMALISAQRVEFITGKLIEVLAEFDGGGYVITTTEFLEKSEKSKNAIKTLGSIFKLLKLNPTLVIENDLDDYLKMRNLFVHKFWENYMNTYSEEQAKRAVDFCYDFGRFSDRISSFFKGFIYFLALRYVEDRDHLDSETKKWSNDFDYFIKTLQEKQINKS